MNSVDFSANYDHNIDEEHLSTVVNSNNAFDLEKSIVAVVGNGVVTDLSENLLLRF